MKLTSVVILCLVTAGVGAGGVFVSDKLYWDNELKVQMAGRDQLIADLNEDLAKLKTGLGALKATNTEMATLISDSLKNTEEILVGAASIKDKLAAIRSGIVQLRQQLKAAEALQ